MAELFRVFFRVAFLASPPQAVPSGDRPFQVGVLCAVLTYVLALAIDFGIGYATVRALVDITVTGGMLWFALRLLGRQARFQQAYGAYCGAVSYANLAALLIYRSGSSGDSGLALADFVLLVWNLALLGHIIRHTFELRMWISTLAALIYVYVITGLMFAWFPLPAV